MSPLSAVVASGAMVGGGLWLMWTGWQPARPSLKWALDRLGQPVPEAIPVSKDNFDARLGAALRKVSFIDNAVQTMRTDLRVLRRSPDEQAALIVAYGMLGFLWAPIVTAGGWLVGFRLPLAIPLWFALAGAGIGVVTAIRSVKTAAAA